jgi:hypothetical protein
MLESRAKGICTVGTQWQEDEVFQKLDPSAPTHGSRSYSTAGPVNDRKVQTLIEAEEHGDFQVAPSSWWTNGRYVAI